MKKGILFIHGFEDAKSAGAGKAYPMLLAPLNINLLQISIKIHKKRNTLHSCVMESLIKQTRSRFSGARQENKEDRSTSPEKKLIQPQKTQSFKDRKRSHNWIRRQLSRQTSSDYDLSGADYPAAIAAAAFAVQSLEESKTEDKKEMDRRGPSDKSLNTMKNRVEETSAANEPLKSALKPSGEISRKSSMDPDNKKSSKTVPEKEPSFKRRISFADTDETIGKEPEKPTLEEKVSMKKPQSFADKELNKTETMPKPHSIRPITPPVETRARTREYSQAEAWEKEQMATIKERYEKLRDTIDSWENKKKRKAKRKIERTQVELEKKRAKAMQNYLYSITRIEGIAGGARKQAEENQRNEELKVKEKANKIRLTGKIPATCLCF